jgi:hypothetical protein
MVENMKLYRLMVPAALGFSMIGAANVLNAAPIIYDFTGLTAGTNVDLGQSHIYTASGGPQYNRHGQHIFGLSAGRRG